MKFLTSPTFPPKKFVSNALRPPKANNLAILYYVALFSDKNESTVITKSGNEVFFIDKNKIKIKSIILK